MGSGSSSTTTGWIDQTEQTSNGGGDPTQHGDPLDVGTDSRLAIALHCINGPASGNTVVKIQESPDYGIATEGEEHWMDLVSFTALTSASGNTWQKKQIPDGTIYTFFSWLRIVATNSEAGQTCLFDVRITRY